MSRLLQTVAERWWRRIYATSVSGSLPTDAPRIRSGEPDPDRVLVLGSGVASGWGVPTWRLALGGRLAAALERRTGRPCDVDHLGDDAMNVASAPDWIGDRPMDRYDAIVVAVGLSDALRQTPTVRWRAELELLLHRVLQRARPSVDVLVVGIEPVEALPAFRGTLGRLGQRRADRLNAATQRLVAETDRVQYVALPTAETPAGHDDDLRWTYLYWAEYLAASVAPLLGRARAAVDRVPGPVTPIDAVEWRPPAGADVGRLQDLLVSAKAELGADLAWVGVRSEDREVIAATSSGRAPFSVPFDLAFCRLVHERDGLVAIPDVSSDGRVAGNPLLKLLHLESYAGFPLRDVDGEVMGALCVASLRPRSSFTASAPALEQYAHATEVELLRLRTGSDDRRRSARG